MTNRENAAHKLLRILGANGGYLGFYYTATAIEIVMDSGKTIYQCKWLYNEVAERYHTTPFCVERNIRTMVDMIWNYGNRQFLKELVPYPFNAKPKNAGVPYRGLRSFPSPLNLRGNTCQIRSPWVIINESAI